MNILDLIDTQTEGRYDVTPLFARPEMYNKVLASLEQALKGLDIERVLGIDALGFILGASLSHVLQRGFVPIRKANKLPGLTLKQDCIDYSGQAKTLEIRKDALTAGMRVIIVDEWVETGAQIGAAVKLAEAAGAQVLRLVSLSVDDNPQTEYLESKYGFITPHFD